MPVFYCAHCGQPIDADETLAGIEVGCPACLNVVQVPAAAPAPYQPYQPYQPPVFVQGANSPPQHTDPYSSEPDKWRVRAPALGTAAAFVLCLLKKFSEPASSLDVALGNTGLAGLLGGTIGYTLAAGIFALVIALIIAGIAAACQKSFITMFTRSYGIGAVLASLLMIAGPMLQPRSVHSASPPSSLPSSRTSENTREELNKLQADIERMREGAVPANDASPAQPQTPPADATDDAGKLVLISRQYFEELAALQKGYTDELARIGFMRLLDRNRVMADTGFTESYDMLARARVLVRKQGIKMRESLASLPAKIRASNISPAAREDYALSAEKGTPQAMSTFDETWGLEESIINEMETIIDLLSKRRGHWQVSNNQFLFYEDSDLALFNAAMDKINAASAQQNKIRQQGQQKTGKMFDDLRSALPK